MRPNEPKGCVKVLKKLFYDAAPVSSCQAFVPADDPILFAPNDRIAKLIPDKTVRLQCRHNHSMQHRR